jgi:hypothetical protein
MTERIEGGGPRVRVFRIGGGGLGLAAFAIAAIAIGGVFLTVGLMLLAAFVVIGGAVGGALVLYHRLTGRLPWRAKRPGPSVHGLDPSREVFPAPEARAHLRATDE